MIGNDLVDLLTAQQESNWQRPRFLEKIFTPSEIAFIKKATNPALAVWWMWSKKESVYKIIARLEQRRFFAPKKIVCLLDKPTSSIDLPQAPVSVQYHKQTFQTTSFVKEHFLHTIAYQAPSSPFILLEDWYMEKKDAITQSQKVRQKLLAAYAQYTHLEQAYLNIQKDTIGIPTLYYKNKKQFTAFSLSHHGNYVGFAIAFPANPCAK